MAKRITEDRVKKYAIAAGMIGVPTAIALFIMLFGMGVMEMDGYDYSKVCGETTPCWIELYNVTFNEDVFIYPMDPSSFVGTQPSMENLKLYRNWGSGMRFINLSKPCTGTWCGKSPNDKRDEAVFVYAFRKGNVYSKILITGTKERMEVINWKINPEGTFDKFNVGIIYVCHNKTVYWNETIPNYVNISICKNYTILVNCTNETLVNGTVVVECDNATTVLCHIETIQNGTKVITKNKTIEECTPFVEIKDKYLINFTAEDFNCSNVYGVDAVQCDSCKDGNCDGVCNLNGGETCAWIDKDVKPGKAPKYKNSVIPWDVQSGVISVQPLLVVKDK